MDKNGILFALIALFGGIFGKKYIWNTITAWLNKPKHARRDDDFKEHLKNELILERQRHDQQLKMQHERHLMEIEIERERLAEVRHKLTKHVIKKSRGKNDKNG